MNFRLHSPVCLLLAALPALPQSVGGSSGVTEHVSATGGGAVAAASSLAPRISADGRWVAFHTFAALLPADTNGLADVYAYDRWTGTLVGVSVDPGGSYGNGNSYFPDISADGRCVAYESASSNLVGVDDNALPDVYVCDLQTGVNIRASNAWGTNTASSSSSDQASISADGRFVAFRSSSTDLGVPDTNDRQDIYRFDTITGAMVRVSDGPFGQADGHNARPSISGDGGRVAWESWATNLVVGDGNGFKDVFVADVGGLPQIASRTPAGASANSQSGRAAISADGAFVAFNSWASDIAPVTAELNVFRFDLAALQVELVSADSTGTPGDDHSNAATISADGRYVAFESRATNLAPFQGPHWDAFLRDMDEGRTWTVSRPPGVAGVPDGDSGAPDLAGDATLVAFSSRATTLVPGVGNGNQWEVFVRTIHPDPRAYCVASITSSGCQPSVSATGYSSVTGASAFSIDATDVPNQRVGLMFYGLSGPAAAPFGGHTMCVSGPRKRTPVMQSGGSPPAVDDCSGSYSVDMNAFAAGGLGGSPHPALSLVGQQVDAQFWGRDAAGTGGVFLTDALEYVVGP